MAKQRFIILIAVLVVVGLISGITGGFLWSHYHATQQERRAKQREKEAALYWQVQPKIEETQSLVVGGMYGMLDLCKMHIGRYPTTQEGLVSLLLEETENEQLADVWRGPYLRDASQLKDAWENDLVYVSPGIHNQGGYDLSSPGPDGIEGTEDDIVNWN